MLRLSAGVLRLLLVVFLLPAGVSSAPVVGSYGGRQAAWSGDGRRIAFVSGLPHSLPNVWVVNADGSGARQLTDRGGQAPGVACGQQWHSSFNRTEGRALVTTTFRRTAAQVTSCTTSYLQGPVRRLVGRWKADSLFLDFGRQPEDLCYRPGNG